LGYRRGLLEEVLMMRLLGALMVASASALAMADDNLLVNGGFEQGTQGWARAWSRMPSVKAALDEQICREGKAIRIEHTGAQDWSFAQEKRLAVKPGEIYELSGWLRTQGEGSAALSVTLYDARQQAVDWSFGRREVRGNSEWRSVQSRFVIPPDGAVVLPRVTGGGVVTAWADSLSLRRVGQIDLAKSQKLPQAITQRNRVLEVTFHPADGTFTLRDLRCGQQWSQRPEKRCFVIDARAVEGRIEATLLDAERAENVNVVLRLEGEKPELVVELAGKGPMTRMSYPHATVSPAKSWLIMPVNEGIGYPVDDATLRPMRYHLYGGHGLCMAWYGVTDLERGLMMLVETPDDAAVRVVRQEGRLCLAPEWEPQRGAFGYTRRLRYVAFEHGGYVAMTKRHRAHAKAVGLFKTLAQKRQENPNVDLLVGAVNVWAFGLEAVKLCREMQSLGIRRILWSAGGKAEQLAQLNAMDGVLTSRYDIYQDCMDPANFPKLPGKHDSWTSSGWPKDIMLNAEGDWIRGWRVDNRQGESFYCGVLCDRLAPDYARRRIAEELKVKPYRCRFIDTTTASPWRECYAPAHPLTRSESKRWKMELLDVVSREFKLVTGCETGHEASVPYLHYFEGMLSLGPYRVADSGRRITELVDEVPEQVAKFQTGHYYRLPLWELVYHDCTVAQWYWGDYNNKLPKLWDRRDLWNTLYGTPPMFLFERKFWEQNRERFARSYKMIAPVARATGYREMLTHAWLNEEHSVQQTRFDGGVVVTVNFGHEPYRMANGTVVQPMSHHVEGIGADGP
jgi:hypothetical protein